MLFKLFPMISYVAVATAAKLPHPISIRDAGCVDGSPTNTGGYTIEYSDVEMPSESSLTGFILDSGWMEAHETVCSATHFFVGSDMIPWGENKCQYTCNSNPNCASFVGYQSVNETTQNGDLYCHYFDELVQSDVIAVRPVSEFLNITHAYNRLCNQTSSTI